MGEEKDNIVDIDKKELWEQMKKDSPTESFELKFEAIDTEEERRVACYVDVKQPLVTSNFQHAAIFSSMFDWMVTYLDRISNSKEFEDKDIVFNEILEGQTKVSNAFKKMCIRCAPDSIADDVKEFMKEMLEKYGKGDKDE